MSKPDCVPGIRCPLILGCTMAANHMPPCRTDGKPCSTCGAQPWDVCDPTATIDLAHQQPTKETTS